MASRTQDPNPNTPEKARQERDAESLPGMVRVKVGDTPVIVGGTVHDAGAMFDAPVASVHNALGRGLVEKVETKAKR